MLTGGHGASGSFQDTWTNPRLELLRAQVQRLTLLGRPLGRLGITREIWDNGVVPYLLPEVALKAAAAPRRVQEQAEKREAFAWEAMARNIPCFE